jgi:hypothetical protein
MARKTTPKQDAGATASPPPKRVAKPPETKAEIIPVMNEQLFEELLDHIESGKTLMWLEKQDRFPSRGAMRRWIDATEERQSAYEKARENRADYRSEQMDVLIAQVQLGKIDPQSAKIAMDGLWRQMQHENRARYGDSSKIALSVTRAPSEESSEDIMARVLKVASSLPLLDDGASS